MYINRKDIMELRLIAAIANFSGRKIIAFLSTKKQGARDRSFLLDTVRHFSRNL
jgi:hypothetical protein